MTDEPLVSVLMATYNRAKWLPESIGSVLSQTYQNWELFIWNDGSTDDTTNVMATISDSRIQYYSSDVNRGKAYSINKLIELVNGKYIAFLDDDDQWKRNTLSYQITLLEAHKEIDILFGNFENVNLLEKTTGLGFLQNRKSIDNLSVVSLEPGAYLIVNRFLESLMISNFVASDSIVCRQEILPSLRLNENLRNGEDLELWWRLGLAGYKFGYTDRVLMKRLKPSGSLSSPSVLMYQNHLAALESCYWYAKQSQRDDLLPLFRKPFRSSWQGLIRQYAFMGKRKKAISAFIKSCHYGMNIRSIYLLVGAMVGPKIISKWRRQ